MRVHHREGRSGWVSPWRDLRGLSQRSDGQELVYIKDLILTKLRTALPGIPLEDIRATLKAKVQNHQR